MYIIKELKLTINFSDLIFEILKYKLWFNLKDDEIYIFEKKQRAVNEPVNQPIIIGSVNYPKVTFTTPFYDVTFPYPGGSKKLVKFLRYICKKYNGVLKIEKK
jgi:hypothetical protein